LLSFLHNPILKLICNHRKLSFFSSKYEVSKADYQIFLAKMSKLNKSTKTIEIDSLNRERELSYVEPLKTHYHNNPALANYPVVNISFEGATEYCK